MCPMPAATAALVRITYKSHMVAADTLEALQQITNITEKAHATNIQLGVGGVCASFSPCHPLQGALTLVCAYSGGFCASFSPCHPLLGALTLVCAYSGSRPQVLFFDEATHEVTQTLEGDETVVRSLFARINNDSRHSTVNVTEDTAVDQRQFPEWGMLFCRGVEKRRLPKRPQRQNLH